MTNYTSVLTDSSPIYDRFGGSGKYYYEAIKISVPETGYYFFGSYSNIDTYGYLYSNSFNPLNIEQNLITGDNDAAQDFQFIVQHQLTSTKTYILVVTTNEQMVRGSILIFSYGPKEVKFSPMKDLSSSSTKFNLIAIHYLSVIFGFILRHLLST
jgi:hypothetical protein